MQGVDKTRGSGEHIVPLLELYICKLQSAQTQNQIQQPMNSNAKNMMSRRFSLAVLTPALCLLAASVARADYFSTVTNDHPVAYFSLQDPSGSDTVADASTNDFLGLVNYVTQADHVTIYPQLGQPGIDTNAALFATSTGIGQGFIDLPVNSIVNPTTDGTNGAPFSAELWVQATTGATANFEVPLDDSSDFGQPPPWNQSAGWNFYQTQGPGSTWSYSIRPNPGYVGGGAPVVIGEWAHLVLTYDGTDATLYVNGAQIRKDAVPQFLANNGAEDMIVGEGPATGYAPFDGYVTQVAIYNYPLSAAQVSNHYAVGTNEIRLIPTPPSFSVQPAPATTYAGVPVTFSSQALGTAPLSYHWVRQGSGPIPNATNNTYTITPSYPADNNAQFFVTVTNIAGSTNSTAATLTVLTNLNINNSPFSITRRVGSHAAFRVAANGAEPITYLWHVVSNSVDTPIPGATSDTLWLTNVQTSLTGNSYYAQVTGPFGAAPSSPASLTVVPRTNSAALSNTYSAVILADNPVAFWRLDESTGATNAVDDAGSFDGVYSAPSGILTFGYPSGIPHDTDTGIHVTNTAIVTIPYALELNPVSGPWSYEFWIQPTSLSGNFPTPISSEGNPNMGANLYGWNIYQHAANVWTWNIYNGTPNGSFTSEFADNPIVPGTWYHMVLTDDGTNMVWYSNDRLVFSTTAAAVGFIQNGVNGDPTINAGPTTLAVRSDGVFGDWDGGIEDVAVYNYVLSPLQIQNHFLNSTHVSITESGGKVVVTWPVGTLQSATSVAGPYSTVVGASSPYTNTPSGQVYYRIQLP
jgi:hypothetical protein